MDMTNKFDNIPQEKFQFAKRSDLYHDKKFDTKPVSYFQGAFRRFCKNKGAVYVDLSLYKVQTSMWKAGDWYYAEDDGQYNGIYEVVTTHPNEMGCLLQANAFLRSAGYDEIKKTHHITINVSSGIVATTPNNVWLEDGIVTVRIESGNVSSFSVSKKSGGSVAYTQRNNDLNTSYNTYYTFTMPNEDVVVNIS